MRLIFLFTYSMEWEDSVVEFVELIREKSVNLSQKHTASFFYYKRCMNLFDIPVVIFSVFSSFISVGVSAFISQPVISITTAGVSMAIAILGSIKLYLNLTSNTALELQLSKDFHILALDVSKMLFIPCKLRKMDQIEFLNKVYDTYIDLIQKSSLIKQEEERKMIDQKKINFTPKAQFRNPLTIVTT